MDKRTLHAYLALNAAQREVVNTVMLSMAKRQAGARERCETLFAKAVHTLVALCRREYGISSRRSDEALVQARYASVLFWILEKNRNANLDQAVSHEGPTPEAMRKARCRPDPILRMEAQGHIEYEHVRAAKEINQVFEAITSQLTARCVRIDGASGARRKSGGRPESGFMADFLADWYTNRYIPWSDIVDSDPRLDLGLVLMVVVDGVPVSEARRTRRMSHSRAVEVVKDALGLYDIIRAGHKSAERVQERDYGNAGGCRGADRYGGGG